MYSSAHRRIHTFCTLNYQKNQHIPFLNKRENNTYVILTVGWSVTRSHTSVIRGTFSKICLGLIEIPNWFIWLIYSFKAVRIVVCFTQISLCVHFNDKRKYMAALCYVVDDSSYYRSRKQLFYKACIAQPAWNVSQHHWHHGITHTATMQIRTNKAP